MLKRLSWVALVLPVVTGCSAKPQSALNPVGPVGNSQLALITQSLVVMTFVALVVFGSLTYVLIRFRQRPGDKLPKQVHGNNLLEILWTAIPVLLLLYLAVPTVADAFYVSTPPKGQTLHVRVIAHQFYFEFQYPDLGVKTNGEVHMPVGVPVEFDVETADVIHGFWIPRLGGKIDAIPGRVNKIWYQADQAGVYPGQCSFLCGAGHAEMFMKAVAEPRDQFDQWIAEQRQKQSNNGG